ncbi:MAG TPA: response regulator [Bacteroidales bacterium]|jgi:response regulator RpfG family c-di-GMP phosphodiesterase|nr:response regulator [Bacteroidales bacterium]
MSEKIKMLYVDDESINLQLFEVNFSENYTVLTADNGFSGLELLENDTDISVVISDMRMPKMDGLEFIKKARDKFPQKRFYLLTGFDMTDEIKEALDKGLIIKCFRKPYNKNEIERAIKEVS